jgi:hypothetical protein
MSIPFDAVKPINRWAYDFIQPGNVGSVGDVNVTPRLRNSSPDMPVRFDPEFYWGQRLGMNVQNGTSLNFWGNQFPQKLDSNWDLRPGFRTSHGWIHQDLRAPDKIHEPKVGQLPQFSWDNKIATTYNAMRTGNMFLPLPGRYGLPLSETPRGQVIPRIVDTEQGDGLYSPLGDQSGQRFPEGRETVPTVVKNAPKKDSSAVIPDVEQRVNSGVATPPPSGRFGLHGLF